MFRNAFHPSAHRQEARVIASLTSSDVHLCPVELSALYGCSCTPNVMGTLFLLVTDLCFAETWLTEETTDSDLQASKR